MKISELRELLKDKRVVEEINKHLWIESQKAGYSIGMYKFQMVVFIEHVEKALPVTIDFKFSVSGSGERGKAPRLV